MCLDPLTGITMGLGIMNTVASYEAQKTAQKAQVNYYNRQVEMQNDYNQKQADALKKSYMNNLNSTEYTNTQKYNDTVNQQNVLANKALQASGAIRARSNEEGVSGLSVDALMSDMYSQYDVSSVNAWQNYLRQEHDIRFTQQDLYNRTASSINQQTNPYANQVIPGINLAPALGQAFSSTLGAAKGQGYFDENNKRYIGNWKVFSGF